MDGGVKRRHPEPSAVRCRATVRACRYTGVSGINADTAIVTHEAVAHRCWWLAGHVGSHETVVNGQVVMFP